MEQGKLLELVVLARQLEYFATFRDKLIEDKTGDAYDRGCRDSYGLCSEWLKDIIGPEYPEIAETIQIDERGRVKQI